MLGFLRKKIKQVLGKAEEPKQGPAAPKQVKVPEKKIFWNREQLLEELETSLIECGVAFEVIDVLLKGIEDQHPREWKQLLRKKLLEILQPAELELTEKPYAIMVCGVNGTGKTTTVAKLARRFQDKGKSVVVAAADTFRSAAMEQLAEHCDKLGVKMVRQEYGADPAAVAFDAVEHAEARGIDVVLIDTSGRMHVDSGLMRELEKIKRVTKPHLSLLTVDSTTGNDAVAQAQTFGPLVDGVVLTKFDVDERGGALISVSAVTGKPVYFLGTGQDYGDLEPLKPKAVVKAIGL